MSRYFLSFCEHCGANDHEAVYDHEGRFHEGPVYAVECPADLLTDYYTAQMIDTEPDELSVVAS